MLVLAGIVTAINLLLVYQAFVLSRIFRSQAWLFIAWGFGLSGLRQVLEVIGLDLTSLSVLRLVTLSLICVGFHLLRQDLRRIGV